MIFGHVLDAKQAVERRTQFGHARAPGDAGTRQRDRQVSCVR